MSGGDVSDVQPLVELSRREVRELAAGLPFLGEAVAYADEQAGNAGEDGPSCVGMPLDVLQELRSALGLAQSGAAGTQGQDQAAHCAQSATVIAAEAAVTTDSSVYTGDEEPATVASVADTTRDGSR